MFLIRIKYVLFLLLNVTYALGQKDSIIAENLNPIVVTATLNPTNSFKLPFQVNKITSSDIQQTLPRTTPDILKNIPGVFVQHTNLGGGSPIIRGFMGNQILLLKDGIRINNSTYRYGPNQYLNTVDLFSVKTLEILQGTGSVQFGSDAMGGIIHVFSDVAQLDSSSKKFSASLDGITRSHKMETSYHAVAQYRKTNYVFRGSITARKFGHLLGGQDIGFQIPSGYKENDYQFSFRWKPSVTSEWLFFSESVNQIDVPVFHKVALENFKDYSMSLQQRDLNYIKYGKKLLPDHSGKLTATLSFQKTIEIRKFQKQLSELLRIENDQVGTMGLQVDWYQKIGRNLSHNIGIEKYMDLVKSVRVDQNSLTNNSISQRGLYPNNAKYHATSIYGLQHFNWKKIKLETGVRFSRYIISLVDSTFGNVVIKPHAWVYNASFNYEIVPSKNLYFSFQNTFRAPNIDDMGTLGYVDNRYETPAYNLKPEKAENIEGGLKSATKNSFLTTVFFYSNIRDLITRVRATSVPNYNSIPVYYKENIDRAYIKGFNASYIYADKKWMIYTNVSYQFGQNSTKNEPLRRIPPLFGAFKIGYHSHRYNISLHTLAAAAQKRLSENDKLDNRIGTNGTAGWIVYNLHTDASFRHLKISVSVQNLFNASYKYHGSGIYGMGRSLLLQWHINL